MARSAPVFLGPAESYQTPTSNFPMRSSTRASGRPAARISGRSWSNLVLSWLMRSQQHRRDQHIERYLRESGIERFTDTVERDIEYRFLAGQQTRW